MRCSLGKSCRITRKSGERRDKLLGNRWLSSAEQLTAISSDSQVEAEASHSETIVQSHDMMRYLSQSKGQSFRNHRAEPLHNKIIMSKQKPSLITIQTEPMTTKPSENLTKANLSWIFGMVFPQTRAIALALVPVRAKDSVTVKG